MNAVFLIICMLFAHPAFSAQCQVNGKWYPYSDPICSGNSNRTQSKSFVQPKSSSNNPVCQISESKAAEDIKDSLRKKYPDSYSLQKTLYDAQMKSYSYLCSLPATDVNTRILNKRLSQYYPMFSLIETLYEADIKAYKELNH